MRLVLRVTAAIFLLLTISSVAIGYFAITKYRSSQINLVDDSLNSKVKALVATKEDPLTVAQYLAQVSEIPATIEYVTESGLVTVLTVSGPAIPNLPNAATLLKARHIDMNDGANLRIRVFEMPNNQRLILAESLETINSEVSILTRDLVLFILGIDILASFVAFLVFRRDGKLNQVSHLMARQQLAMQKFLGDASHELRTPLTVIKGYVDLSRTTTDRTKQENYLAKTAKEIFRMESIIKDLLFLAEAGDTETDEVESVNLGAILRDHLEVLQALQPGRNVTTTIDSEVIIQANPKLIDRMVGNVFSNIRRHTPEGAPVSVSLSYHQKEIILSIEDGGPGLDEYSDKSRIVKRFTTQRSKEGGGSGLGLNIITSVVDRYHGSLVLAKSKLGGLRVEIKLPL